MRGHLKNPKASESDVGRPGSVIMRGPRTLKDSKDPQLLVKGLEDRK